MHDVRRALYTNAPRVNNSFLKPVPLRSPQSTNRQIYLAFLATPTTPSRPSGPQIVWKGPVSANRGGCPVTLCRSLQRTMALNG